MPLWSCLGRVDLDSVSPAVLPLVRRGSSLDLLEGFFCFCIGAPSDDASRYALWASRANVQKSKRIPERVPCPHQPKNMSPSRLCAIGSGGHAERARHAHARRLHYSPI